VVFRVGTIFVVLVAIDTQIDRERCKLLLVLASTVVLGSGPHGIHYHILLSHDSGSLATLTALSMVLKCFVSSLKYLVRTSQKTLMHVVITSNAARKR
jgi:hypothetical protein